MAFSSPLHMSVCSRPLSVHALFTVGSQAFTEHLPWGRLCAGGAVMPQTLRLTSHLWLAQTASWGFEFFKVSLISSFI